MTPRETARALINSGDDEAVARLVERADEAENALIELVECARLRGDNELPHPCDDPKLWTARMIEAWAEAEMCADVAETIRFATLPAAKEG